MEIGVVIPHTQMETDVDSLRRFGTGIEQAGYRHLLAYDHVLGADATAHAPWIGRTGRPNPYSAEDSFNEVFVLFGYLAAVTKLNFVTGVLVLPQRQTALVAKQAAQVDILCEGRLRLGIGIGWNQVEMEGLGKQFRTRARRFEEQIGLLRQLWSEPVVTYEGAFEQIAAAGINPLPIQRPIPLWLGGKSAPAYERMGRLADGWLPEMQPGEELDDARAQIAKAAAEAGRDPASIPMNGRVLWTGDQDKFLEDVDTWRALGASHLSVNTLTAGLRGVDEHLEALSAIAPQLAAV